MIDRLYTVKNGDYDEPMIDYKCDECGRIMCCSWPRIDHDNKNYCGDCALIMDIVDGFKYAKSFLYFFSGAYWAEIIDGIPHIYSKVRYRAKIKREATGKVNKRNSPEYKLFRKFVYERDNYTCQHCFKRGGELNAHHIKRYKDHKKLRLTVSNGVTLCKKCHKKEHGRLNNGKTI